MHIVVRLCVGVPALVGLVAEAGAQACPDETPGDSHVESFEDEDTEGEGSVVSGWGSGRITLQRKGASFAISTQAVGLKLTGIAYGDFDGDGWTDVIGATDDGGCHLHFMKNLGTDVNGVHRGFSSGAAEGLYTEHIVGTCEGGSDFTCAHVAAGNFNRDTPADQEPRVDFFYAHTDCRGGGRANNVRIYRNLGNNANGVPTWDYNDDTDVFRVGRITTYKNYMPFKGFDWNDDGLDDIVAVAGWDDTSELQVYLANGANTVDIAFDPKIVVIPDLDARKPMANDTERPSGSCVGRSHGPSGFGLADYDNDGFLDIVFGSVTSNFLTYWRGVDADNFVKVGTIPYPEGSVTFFNAADMDDDGDADLVMGRDGYTCGGLGGLTFMYPNDGEGNFSVDTRRTLIDYGHDYDSGLVFDFTNDGLPDVMASDGNNIGEYSVAVNGSGAVYSLEGQALSVPDSSLVDEGEVLTSIRMSTFDIGCVDNLDCDAAASLTVFVSNDAGATWERLRWNELPRGGTPGQRHYFRSFGSVFRWRIDFTAEEDTLTGEDAQYAPASKESPEVREVRFDTFKIPKFSFSRSTAELASLIDSDGDFAEYVYTSSFQFPGFEAELRAIDVTELGETSSSRGLERVDEFDGTQEVWSAQQRFTTQSVGDRTIYTAYDSDADGAIDDRMLFTVGNAAVLDDLLELGLGGARILIEFVRDGFNSSDDFRFYNPGHSSPVFSRAPLPVGVDRDDELGPDGDEIEDLIDAQGAAYGNYAADAGDSSSYRAFLERLRDDDVPPVVFIGANDGMVHAFDALTGTELWGFIPHNLLSKLKTTRRFVRNEDGDIEIAYEPQFLVDGPLSVEDVQVNGVWRRLLIGGQAQGKGRLNRNYYFALDITDPRDPLPLWEFTDAVVEVDRVCNPQQGAVVECVPETCPVGACSNDCSARNSIFVEANAATGIVIEAEDFNVNDELVVGQGWTVMNDTDASGGRYLQAPEFGSCATPGSCGGLLFYEIEAEQEGEYYVFSRTRSDFGEANLDNNDAFYFSSQNDPRVAVLNEVDERIGWGWDNPGNVVRLVRGDNTLYLWTRDGGHALDKIVLRQVQSTTGLTGTGPAQTCLEQCAASPGCDQDCDTVLLDVNQPWPYCDAGEFCCDSGDEEVFICSPDPTCSNVTTAQTLGETWSRPTMGRVDLSSGDEWFAFFGSGYDNIEGDSITVGRSVYAISLEDGEIYERWDIGDLTFDESQNPSTIDNTLPGGVRLADVDQDGYVDRAYFGDLEGRMWKADLSVRASANALRPGGEVEPWPENENPWDACVIFDAGQPSTDGVPLTGPRTWAPIITTPAVALFDDQRAGDGTPLPLVYFGTGGDDSAPDDLGYKFYAVRDDITCAQDPKRERELRASAFEWVIGDGLETDFVTPLSDPDSEGTLGQRYWTDPVIANGAIVYFGSVFGDIETIDPCASLADAEATRFYGVAVRPFATRDEFGNVVNYSLGQGAIGSPGDAAFAAAPVKLRTQAQVKSASASISNEVYEATEQVLDEVFIQGLSQEAGSASADVYTLNSGGPDNEVLLASTLRITRWREISLD